MKRVLSIVLVLILCSALFACGKNETSVPTIATSTATQSVTTTTNTVESTTEEYDSVLFITINPQFTLYFNSVGKIIAFEAVNKEAKSIEPALDLIGKKFEDAIYDIIIQANKKGYITSEKTLLISLTEAKNIDVADMLTKAFNSAIKAATDINVPFKVIAQDKTGVLSKPITGSSNSTTTTTTTKSTTTTKTTASSTITKQEALKIAKDMVNKYELLGFYGTTCDFEDVSDAEGERIVAAVEDSLTPAQQEIVRFRAYIVKYTCCSTHAQALNHTKEYMDDSLVYGEFKDHYFQYNGSLYFAMQGRGGIGFDNVRIKSFDDNRIIAHTDTYGDWEDMTPTTVFTIEKVNGTFKLMDVETQWPY